MDKFLKQDINELVNTQANLLKQFEKKTVLVTGATGLIGTHLVQLLVQSSQQLKLNIKIVALVRSLEKAQIKFGKNSNCVQWVVGDVNQLINYEDAIDYVIHCASSTTSKDFIDYPVETIMTTVNGTNNILQLCRDKGVKSCLYLSSMEVYGKLDEQNILENMVGYIDFTSIRSSYSEGKRMAECLCMSYASQYDVPIKIARLTQTFGPCVEYSDNRVFAQFARAVIEEKDIILHTNGETMRNYCYTKDAISALLTVLLCGENGEAYNVANEDTFISIRDLAELVAKMNTKGTTVVRIENKDTSKLGYNPIMKINLESKKLQQLGWRPETSLETMFSRLIGSMQLNQKAINDSEGLS